MILEYDPAKNAFEKVQFDPMSVAYSLNIAILSGSPGDVWEERVPSDCARTIPLSGPKGTGSHDRYGDTVPPVLTFL